MDIGFIGLGKLGFPVASVIGVSGHKVYGYDLDKVKMRKERPDILPYEVGLSAVVERTNLEFVSLKTVLESADLVFVAVETPHDLAYEGITPLPSDRKDFDYTALKRAVSDITAICSSLEGEKIIAIISTVLPGTVTRELLPLCSPNMKLVYNPSFIAMGTVVEDYLSPEFALVGTDDTKVRRIMEDFYRGIHNAPIVTETYETAEMIKVCYNTFISLKIAFANTVMELCHKIPAANCDKVVCALMEATDRVVSAKYMRGGMGDGGACHPRDNIAMSWLARKHDLSHDLFEDAMVAREDQTRWLAEMLFNEASTKQVTAYPKIIIYGYAYKPHTKLIDGSCAILLCNVLKASGAEVEMWDPYVDGFDAVEPTGNENSVYLIGARHKDFLESKFPKGSTVFDPWRYLSLQKGVKIISVGE